MSDKDRSIFQILSAARFDRQVKLSTMYRRDWRAIIEDVVAAVSFGSGCRLDVEEINTEGADPTVTFATSGQAEVFVSFCNQRRESYENRRSPAPNLGEDRFHA